MSQHIANDLHQALEMAQEILRKVPDEYAMPDHPFWGKARKAIAAHEAQSPPAELNDVLLNDKWRAIVAEDTPDEIHTHIKLARWAYAQGQQAAVAADRQQRGKVEPVAAMRAAIEDALEFLDERYGNKTGDDWNDADAAAVGDMLQMSLSAVPQAEKAPSVQAAQPFQGGLNTYELLAAWQKKLPNVPPSYQDLTCFALGIEVGCARARNLAAQDWSRVHHALAKAGVHPGRTDEHVASIIERLAAERDAATVAHRQQQAGVELSDETLFDLIKEEWPWGHDSYSDFIGLCRAAIAADRQQRELAATAPGEWHAPGLGEVHSPDHKDMIYCERDDIVCDELAKQVCAALNSPITSEPQRGKVEPVAWLPDEPTQAIWDVLFNMCQKAQGITLASKLADIVYAHYFELLAAARGQTPQAEKAPSVQAADATWCMWVAGMICAYLGGPVDDPRIPVISGIIGRRLSLLNPTGDAIASELQQRTESWLKWLDDVNRSFISDEHKGLAKLVRDLVAAGQVTLNLEAVVNAGRTNQD